MKKVLKHAAWSKQVRAGEIAVIGKAVDEALKAAFEELGLNIEVKCRGDLDAYGLHFEFNEKEKPKPQPKPAPLQHTKIEKQKKDSRFTYKKPKED